MVYVLAKFVGLHKLRRGGLMTESVCATSPKSDFGPVQSIAAWR